MALLVEPRDGLAPLLRHLHPLGHEPALGNERIPLRRHGGDGRIEPPGLVGHPGRIGGDLVFRTCVWVSREARIAASRVPPASSPWREATVKSGWPAATRSPSLTLSSVTTPPRKRADAHRTARRHEGAAGGLLAGVFGGAEEEDHDGHAGENEAAEEPPGQGGNRQRHGRVLAHGRHHGLRPEQGSLGHPNPQRNIIMRLCCRKTGVAQGQGGAGEPR